MSGSIWRENGKGLEGGKPPNPADCQWLFLYAHPPTHALTGSRTPELALTGDLGYCKGQE